MNALLLGILKTSIVFPAPGGREPARGTVWGRLGVDFGALWCPEIDCKVKKEAVREAILDSEWL